MKTILSLSISALLVLSHGVFGQDYVFRVLANKGSNQVVKSGGGDATSLKTGSKLGSGDQIIAAQGAYIGLVHRTGKTMEIRTPGTHKVNDLEGKVSKGSAGAANRYMNFVMNKMNEDDGNVNKNYRRNLNATGAVERATGSVAIKMLLKDAKNPNKVFGEKATIKWESSDEVTGSYVVTVKNVFDELLFTSETTSPEYALDFTQDNLSKEKFIIVNVKSKNSESLKSRDYGIQRMKEAEAKEITAQLTDLKAELGDESSLNSLVVASFFEENQLYLDALTQYSQAVELSPDVEDFQSIYQEFVDANGLGN